MENYGILLVDDEPAYHAIVTALLLPYKARVDCASSRTQALEHLRTQQYDLILMDIEMPEADGYRTVADIRAVGEWAMLVPIIAFSTVTPDAGLRHFIEEGFDGWLRKPFMAAELVAELRHWLGADRVGKVAVRPGAKLAELIGEEQAEAMIDRLHTSLGEAVAAIDGGAEARSYGHRLGGLAGTLGYDTLSAAWLSLQHGDNGVWPTVRTLTIEAIERRAVQRGTGTSH